ncbi:hypothetical protein [Sulfuritalea sp.]|uniref:hypothetical protein n=1 Tax=Sulfuritalea sp. TaxID=2480090 RepID=UPI00286E354F|nr:hypothetical protein [Sulfuritalea sp.]
MIDRRPLLEIDLRLRGGFPQSFLAPGETESLAWRWAAWPTPRWAAISICWSTR